MQVPPSTLTHIGFGCSDFQLKTRNKDIICARSMEFSIPMDSQLVVYPSNVNHSSTAPDGTKGLEWTSKYGFIGICPFNLHGPDEGMNEKGLSFGYLTLECSKYQTISDSEKSIALALIDVGTWILGNFASVEEVKEAITKVRVWGEFIKSVDKVPGLHIALHDAWGNNLVIEFINGEAIIHENPLGVLTNDPPLDWQINNISQYNYLTPESAASIEINGTIVPTIGTGSGMIGLPGDWSSITRFVRIATAVRFAIQPKTAEEGVELANHILNIVDLPKGMMIKRIENTKLYETTQWVIIKDLTNKILYYHCYTDSTLKAIDLKKITFHAGNKYNKLNVHATSPTIIDVTDKLNLS